MARVYIVDDIPIDATDIELKNAKEVVDIMENNYISIVDILKIHCWELPDFQEAARQLDIEYRPVCTTGASLLSLFKKMEVTEQREFLSLITDSIISYYRSDLTVAWPSDL
jgi:hypothetical protein